MADPNSVDDIAKVAGGGGAAALIAGVLAFFARASTATRMDALVSQMSELNAKVSTLVAASERRDHEHERLDAGNRLSDLEAGLAAVERLLDATVHR